MHFSDINKLKSDIIYIANVDGNIVSSWPLEQATKWVNKGKGVWVSPNLVQSLKKIRCKNNFLLQTNDIIFTNHFNSAREWNANLAEIQRIHYQNKLNTLRYLSQKRIQTKYNIFP